jgi:hypothetical protein
MGGYKTVDIGANHILCEKREIWLERLERIVADVLRGLESRGCRTSMSKATGSTIRGMADCGSCKVVLEASLVGEIPPGLKLISHVASREGWGRVSLTILTEGECEAICKTIELILLRGGG